MQRMTINRKGILFVVDESSYLLGVVSDGDIRRALLEDALMITPVGKVMNINPITIQVSSAELAFEVANRFNVPAIPVTDAEGHLRDIWFVHSGQVVRWDTL